jgi:hypothetical protein
LLPFLIGVANVEAFILPAKFFFQNFKILFPILRRLSDQIISKNLSLFDWGCKGIMLCLNRQIFSKLFFISFSL